MNWCPPWFASGQEAQGSAELPRTKWAAGCRRRRTCELELDFIQRHGYWLIQMSVCLEASDICRSRDDSQSNTEENLCFLAFVLNLDALVKLKMSTIHRDVCEISVFVQNFVGIQKHLCCFSCCFRSWCAFFGPRSLCRWPIDWLTNPEAAELDSRTPKSISQINLLFTVKSTNVKAENTDFQCIWHFSNPAEKTCPTITSAIFMDARLINEYPP